MHRHPPSIMCVLCVLQRGESGQRRVGHRSRTDKAGW